MIEIKTVVAYGGWGLAGRDFQGWWKISISWLWCWWHGINIYQKSSNCILMIHAFIFKIFFLCGPFLKSLLNLLQYCFCFMFWFFGHEACGILAPRPGIEPVPSALEGEVLTTGLPGKSRMHFNTCKFSLNIRILFASIQTDKNDLFLAMT